MKNYETEYLALMEHIVNNGQDFKGRGTIPDRRGIWCAAIRIPLTVEGVRYWPLMTTKKANPKWIVEELRWMLSGSTFEPHLTNSTNDNVYPVLGHSCAKNKGPSVWAEWATAEQAAKYRRGPGDLGPVYGHAWRNHGATACFGAPMRFDPKEQRWVNAGFYGDGVDQIARLVNGLIANPYGTRHIIDAWEPVHVDGVALPPCHPWVQFCVRENPVTGNKVLNSVLTMRSNDLFLGAPYNIAFYSLLTHLLAEACGYEAGEFVFNANDCHLYHNQFDAVKEQIQRTPHGAPVIKGFKLGGVRPLDQVLNFQFDQLELGEFTSDSSLKVEVNV